MEVDTQDKLCGKRGSHASEMFDILDGFKWCHRSYICIFNHNEMIFFLLLSF